MNKQKHTKRKSFLRELAISLASAYMEKWKKLPRNELSVTQDSQLKIQLVVATMKLVHLKNVRVTNLLKAGVLDVENVIHWERLKASGHQPSAFYLNSNLMQ